MWRGTPVALTVAMVLGLGGLGACGKKGPPLAPLRPTPAPVADLVARRIGSTVALRFTIPDKNDAPVGTSPASLDRLEVFAFTDDPTLAVTLPIGDRDLLAAGTKVATIAVQPPPPPVEETPRSQGEPAAARPAPPADPRPPQGTVLVVTEHLDTVSREPIDRTKLLGIRLPVPKVEPASRVAAPLGPPPPLRPPVRTYAVVGYSRRGDRGALSARVSVPLGDPPLPPSAPVLAHTQTAVQITWTPPPDAPVPVQVAAPDPVPAPAAATAPAPASATPPATTPSVPAPSAPPAAVAAPPPAAAVQAPAASTTPAVLPRLKSSSNAASPPPYSYNVYAVDGPDGTPGVVPLNPNRILVPSWEHPDLTFGEQRCYAVRAVRYYLNALGVEGAASPVTCVTPRDIFPPKPPANLTAVATEDAISLIWDRSTDTDVAGYLVLRGEAPGETLTALTADPINTTTYRDGTVSPGVRYVYAVVAVDRAEPPNRSDPSNRVEESAR